MNQQPEIGCARTSITGIKEFQEFGNYQEPIICNMWRGYTEINLSEDIQPILTVFVIVSSLERSEKFIIFKKKPNRLYKQKAGFYYLWFKMFVYFIKYANTRHCQSLTSTVNPECYSCRGSMICFLLGYCCRDFHGKSFHCTTFVLPLQRFLWSKIMLHCFCATVEEILW